MDRAEVHGQPTPSEHEVRALALDDIFAGFAEVWAEDMPGAETADAQEAEPPALGGVIRICQGFGPR